MAAISGFAVSVAVPLSCGASRSTTARAMARPACSESLSTSSVNFSFAGPGAIPAELKPRRQRWRQRRDQAGDLTKRRGAGSQRQSPGGIDTVETAGAFDRHAAGIADFQLIQRDRGRTVAQLRQQRMQRLTGRGGAADIERQLRRVRPFRLRACQRARECRRRIEIETVGFNSASNREPAVLPIGLKAQGALPRRRRRSRPAWHRSPRDPRPADIAAQAQTAFDCDR